MHKSWKIPKDKFERDAKSAGHRHNRLEDQVRHTRRGQQHSQTLDKIARRRPQNSRLPKGVGVRSGRRLQKARRVVSLGFVMAGRPVQIRGCQEDQGPHDE